MSKIRVGRTPSRAPWTFAIPGRAGGVRLAVALVCAAALGTAEAPQACADEILLADGSRIEGELQPGPDADTVHVVTRYATLALPRTAIRSIRRGLTREQQYVERARATDFHDPQAIRALARWARGKGLVARGAELERTALEIELEQRLAEALPHGAAAVLALARWADAQRRPALAPSLVRRLYERAAELDPAFVPAQQALARFEQRVERERARRERARAAIAARVAERERLAAERERQRAARRAALERWLAEARNDDDDLMLGYAGTEPRRSRVSTSYNGARVRYGTPGTLYLGAWIPTRRPRLRTRYIYDPGWGLRRLSGCATPYGATTHGRHGR